ncbi:hypothetical protein BH20ACT22_BH20ACT22_18410 [soil metagenome]
MTPDEFLAHRIGHGMSRYRFESPEARVTCLNRVQSRLTRTDPSDLVHRMEVIYVIALAGE